MDTNEIVTPEEVVVENIDTTVEETVPVEEVEEVVDVPATE